LRIKKNPALGFGAEKTCVNGFAGSIAAGKFLSACGCEDHRTAANELIQKATQQAIHRNHHGERARETNLAILSAIAFDACGTDWFRSREIILLRRVPIR